MRNNFILIAFTLLYVLGVSAQTDKEIVYSNPLWDGYLADPYMFKASDGFYYAVGTGLKDDNVNNNGVLEYVNHFPLIKSKDLKNWKLVGGILPSTENNDFTRYWAPEIVEWRGKFYLFYSGDFRIRVAVADRVEGPYKDSGKALLENIGFNIDGHPFYDPVSKSWYLFIAKKFNFKGKKGTGLAVVKLSDDLLSVEGKIHNICKGFKEWQLFNPDLGDYCVEGATVIYKEGKYWCFYSGGNWKTPTYGVGCLVSDDIMGSYIDNWSLEYGSVLKTIDEKLIGPGHTSVILAPDNITYLLVYHSWNEERNKRQVCMAPIEWTTEGPKVLNAGRGERKLKLF